MTAVAERSHADILSDTPLAPDRVSVTMRPLDLRRLCRGQANLCNRPTARGRGVAKAILRRIDEEACRADKPVLRREAGTYQPEGDRSLRAHGFSPGVRSVPMLQCLPAILKRASFSRRSFCSLTY
jgi:hypothetical protein